MWPFLVVRIRNLDGLTSWFPICASCRDSFRYAKITILFCFQLLKITFWAVVVTASNARTDNGLNFCGWR